MNHPRSLLLPTLAALTLSLSACGPAKETAANAEAPASASTTTPAPAPNVTEAQLASGRNVFTRVCAVCHQPNGLGVPGVFPPLVGSEVVDGDPARVIHIVLSGLQGPIEVNGKKFNSVMPPQGALLKDEEIADAISYVRNSWGHTASPVSAADVAKLRAEGRTTMWTWAELSGAAK